MPRTVRIKWRTTTGNMNKRTVKKLLDSKDWLWRHAHFKGENLQETQAAEYLREQYKRAADWLVETSAATGIRLPVGNGANDAWERIAFVTAAGNYGMIDIAKGVAIEWDVKVPDYVALFAQEEPRAVGHNAAAGSGAKIPGWRQLLVVLGRHGEMGLCSAPTPLQVTYGLATCYGTIGSDPRMIDSDAIKNFECVKSAPHVETTEPQREQVLADVHPDMWREFIKKLPWKVLVNLSNSDGHLGIGNVRLQYVYYTDTKENRAEVRAYLAKHWPQFVLLKACEAAYQVLRFNGITMRPGVSKAGLALSNSNYSIPLTVGDVLARMGELLAAANPTDVNRG